jgi:2-(1,2-epoxy-1,2-dihydrophenyl)acetyl-CoA isomerase
MDELVTERVDALAILRLNRPARMNALSDGILRGLEEGIPQLLADPQIRAILITGTGRAFCAGGDVSSMRGAVDAGATLSGMRACHGWLKALRAADKLVITAINGVAAGGGFGLAMLGDLIVASEDAYFKAAFSSLGAAADYALAFTLPLAVGTVRAADILLTDRRVSAQEALQMGLISRVFPAHQFEANALQFARDMSQASRGAQLTKRLLHRERLQALSAHLETEAQTQLEAFRSDDFAEGVAAFGERRPPRFRGT